MNRFEKLPKDVIVYIGLKLSLSDISSLCRTCKKINKSICENRYFWISRLKSDYGIDYIDIRPINPKTYYRFYKDHWKKSINMKLYYAAAGGHKDIVELMIKYGGTNWNLGLRGAELMIEKGATDCGLDGAAYGGHIDIVRSLIDMGATDLDSGLRLAAIGGHKDIVKFLEDKIKERGY